MESVVIHFHRAKRLIMLWDSVAQIFLSPLLFPLADTCASQSKRYSSGIMLRRLSVASNLSHAEGLKFVVRTRSRVLH